MTETELILYKESVKEEKEKTAGELLGEDLLHILKKTAEQTPGTILWVKHEIETEWLKHIDKPSSTWTKLVQDVMDDLDILFHKKMRKGVKNNG